MEELFRMFNNGMEGAVIHCDDKRCEIKGNPASVLTLLANIFEGLIKNGIEKEDIIKALDVATMNDEELNLELLNSLKEFLENMKK